MSPVCLRPVRSQPQLRDPSARTSLRSPGRASSSQSQEQLRNAFSPTLCVWGRKRHEFVCLFGGGDVPLPRVLPPPGWHGDVRGRAWRRRFRTPGLGGRADPGMGATRHVRPSVSAGVTGGRLTGTLTSDARLRRGLRARPPPQPPCSTARAPLLPKATGPGESAGRGHGDPARDVWVTPHPLWGRLPRPGKGLVT